MWAVEFERDLAWSADRLDQLARTSVVVFSAACSARSGR